MRRTTALTLVLTVLTTLASWTLALPAAAGGPTSVMVTAPGSGSAAGLYHSEALYIELSDLVAVGRPVDHPPVEVVDSGAQVSLTWLIHDVMPWRLDRVYLGADGRPWLSTQEGVGGGDSLWDVQPVWHRGPPRLVQLLDEVLAGHAGGRASTSPQVTPGPRDAETLGATPARSTGVPAALGGALAGLVAGAALVVAGQRWRQARAGREGPAAAPAADAPATDRLAWP